MKNEIKRLLFLLLITQMLLLPAISVITNPTFDWKMTEITRISTGGDAYSLLVEDDYCYVTCGYYGFKIFDVSDRSNPKMVANFPQPDDGYAHQFILKGKIAYIGNGRGGVWIINCTDPENPSEITNYVRDYSWDIQIKDDVLYSANGYPQLQKSITVTNISDLANPVHINTIFTSGDTTDLELVENKLFAASSKVGLWIFDITNKTEPETLGRYSDPENPLINLINFEIVGDIVYAGYYQYGFKVLNVSNTTNITQVVKIQNSSGNYYSIKRFDDFLYVSDISNGFEILDISVRTNPVEILNHNYEGCGTNDIFRLENTLYVADRFNGLIIFNIGDLPNSEGISGFEFMLVICLFSLLWRRRR